MGVTDFVLERKFLEEHLNLSKSGFVREEGHSGWKSQNTAIRALKGNVLCQIWFKWTYQMNLVNWWSSSKNKFAFRDHSFTRLAAVRWQNSMSRGLKYWNYFDFPHCFFGSFLTREAHVQHELSWVVDKCVARSMGCKLYANEVRSQLTFKLWSIFN